MDRYFSTPGLFSILRAILRSKFAAFENSSFELPSSCRTQSGYFDAIAMLYYEVSDQFLRKRRLIKHFVMKSKTCPATNQCSAVLQITCYIDGNCSNYSLLHCTNSKNCIAVIIIAFYVGLHNKSMATAVHTEHPAPAVSVLGTQACWAKDPSDRELKK